MKLSEKQRAILDSTPFTALRPGDNLWPEIELCAMADGEHIVGGEEIEALIRAGLIEAIELPEPVHILQHEDGFDVECRWRYFTTALGQAALELQ